MSDEIVDDDLLFGVLLVLVTDADVEAHDEGAHQAALEEVPESFGGITSQTLYYTHTIILFKKIYKTQKRG